MGKISAGALRVPLMRSLRTLVALAATATVLGAAATAQATDRYPCGPARTSPGGVRDVQYCPLWTGNVPVYNEGPYWSIALGSRKVIGYLYQGGSANWFLDQICLPTNGEFHLGSYYNFWWAYTEADNGKWGYVPEVYFKGGNNNERDAGLFVEPLGWCY